MASKYYGYYLKGNKLALIQKDTTNVTADDYGRYKSPTESVTDGLEIEYTYSPEYRIESIAAGDKETVSSYETVGGFLRFNGTSFSTEATVDYIVISGSGRFDGLHKISGLNTAHYTTTTKYSGANVTETPTIYTNVSALEDESFELDLTRYQANALVYYVKAKIAEDMGDIDQKEYFMNQWKKLIEKERSGRKKGPYIVQGVWNMKNY